MPCLSLIHSSVFSVSHVTQYGLCMCSGTPFGSVPFAMSHNYYSSDAKEMLKSLEFCTPVFSSLYFLPLDVLTWSVLLFSISVHNFFSKYFKIMVTAASLQTCLLAGTVESMIYTEECVYLDLRLVLAVEVFY